ncbi:MAG: flagellar hook-associated protein FlgL [Marinobacterium sp.]
MRLSTNLFYSQNETNISEANSRLYKLQQQLSTGKKLQQPSDDPLATTQIMKFDRVIARTEQFRENISVSERRLSYEETTVASVVTSLQRVQEIAIRGNSGAMSDNDRQILAGELDGILDHVKGLLNTQDAQGEYMFAGYRGDTEPYVLNAGDTAYEYQGDSGERFLDIGENSTIQSTDPGSAIFGDSTDNVLNQILDLKTALESGTDPSAASQGVNGWYENIVSQQAQLGSRLRVLEDQEMNLTDLKTFTESTRSLFADTDYYEAISQLSLESTALQAAYQSFGKVQQMSLFNYVG